MDMKRVELKRIAEFLWKGNPDELKSFAKGTVPGNGAIEKKLEADANKELGKESSKEENGAKIEGPMSITRKMCFAMSFNVWILYFLLLGWLIPCKDFKCGPYFLERNMSSIWPLTNLETYNVDTMPSMVMIGYADGSALHLAAIDAEKDIFKWNNSLSFIPRRIQCNFEIMFDANGDGIADCLLTGYNDVYAFNASDGHVFWEQSLPSDDGNIVSRFHPTRQIENKTYVIGTSGVQVLVLGATDGIEEVEADLPCWSPFDIRIVPNAVSANLTLWTIVCDYGDKVEVWRFEEEELLNKKNSETLDSEIFWLLFRRESNSGGSIDLGSDVTPIPGGPLLLSWSDRVALVTSTTTAWERSFPYPLSVASIKIGHFTTTKELQIAAAVRNHTNSIIYILEMGNGTTVNSVLLEKRQAQEISKVAENQLDSLIVKSLVMNFTSYGFNMTDPIPQDKTNYDMVQFSKTDGSVKKLARSPGIVGSTVISKQDGEVDLLLLKTKNGVVVYQKYVVLRCKKERTYCSAKRHASHFASEM